MYAGRNASSVSFSALGNAHDQTWKQLTKWSGLVLILDRKGGVGSMSQLEKKCHYANLIT